MPVCQCDEESQCDEEDEGDSDVEEVYAETPADVCDTINKEMVCGQCCPTCIKYDPICFIKSDF